VVLKTNEKGGKRKGKRKKEGQEMMVFIGCLWWSCKGEISVDSVKTC
jgi:hypothetical protein